jgi:hypothetical protein
VFSLKYVPLHTFSFFKLRKGLKDLSSAETVFPCSNILEKLDGVSF